ncbi:MAG TPA: ankyrin repeat domain-containing protein [Bryobacteraceae bacterium]|nr:ankyrin repeat domain-containing protein [Bryobacteraceae bacterium]
MRLFPCFPLLSVLAGACLAQEPELFEAVRRGDLARIKSLAGDNASLTVRGAHGRTALHEAASACRLEAAEVLVQAGGDLYAADDQGRTPLAGMLQCPNMNRQALGKMLSSRQNVQAPPPGSEKYPWSLQSAAAHGQAGLVTTLLGMGVDVNGVSPEGNRALDIACLKGHAPMTRLLLEHGADPRLRNKAGSTPLHDAALSGNQEVVELLIAHRAEIDAIDPESGSTPLHYAASFGRLDAVKTLVRHGANLAAKTGQGQTALELSVHNQHEEVAAFLRAALAAR